MARSYEAIKKQIARLEAQAKALASARDNKKARAVARVKAYMKKLGVSVQDLADSSPRAKSATKVRGRAAAKPKSTVAPKFRDPDSGATWTGRGKQPKWLAAAIKDGKKLEDFKI